MKVIPLNKDRSILIKRAKENNAEAQRELYVDFAPKMLGVCRQYIKDLQNAEEVMLNGFLKVFMNLEKFEARGSFEGWIRRIMINESISFLRKPKRLVLIDDDNYFKKEVANDYEAESQISELQLLVDNLRDDLKIVFNLIVIEGYKHKEVSKKLGITVGISRTRFFRARKQLQYEFSQLKRVKNGK